MAPLLQPGPLLFMMMMVAFMLVLGTVSVADARLDRRRRNQRPD